MSAESGIEEARTREADEARGEEEGRHRSKHDGRHGRMMSQMPFGAVAKWQLVVELQN